MNAPTPAFVARSRLAEVLVASAVLLASSFWATHYWNLWVARGGRPIFYQEYFEPAVMVACGHGFVVARVSDRPPALTDFLMRRRDTFSCGEIPSSLALGQDGLYQGNWRYLLYLTAGTWRVLGISWSGLGPLFGLLFGVSVTLVYGICRLGMSRPLAVACAAAVTFSSVHLLNLPHLRDYAKAPFALALFFILGLLVTRPVRARNVVGLSAAYGVVLGVAYGFRTDFLTSIPLFVITLALFVEGGPFRHLKLKAAGGAAFLAAFTLVGWPILSNVYTEGGCQWHNVLLGLQAPFDSNLAVEPAPYDLGYAYADAYVAATIDGFAHRSSPASPPLAFCSHEYDVEGGRYLRNLVSTFPADFVTRGLASTRILAELPFLWTMPPMPGWMTWLYEQRTRWIAPLRMMGIRIVEIALLMIAAANLRLGLFLLVFALYVGSYPAIQFDHRHYFHLEFFTWWSLGVIVQQVVTVSWRAVRKRRIDGRAVLEQTGRMAAFALAGWLLLVVPLGALRAYQASNVAGLLRSYQTAPKVDLARAQAPGALALVGLPMPPASSGLIEVDVDASRCEGPAPIVFRYDGANPAFDFTRTVTVPPSGESGVTRVFVAVYPRFTGLELPGPSSRCVSGAYRLASPEAFPLLIDATLPPGWEHRPLYQRVARWTPW